MDIKTHVRKKNVKTATKILRKGRGAWGDFVNSALEIHAKRNDMVAPESESGLKPSEPSSKEYKVK